MKRTLLLSIGVVALCLIATPAMAGIVPAGLTDLFTFNVTSPQMTYNPSSSLYQFTVAPKSIKSTGGFVTDDADFANFTWPETTKTNADFFLGMTITGAVGNSKQGVGEFRYTDADGDVISGGLVGDWTKRADGSQFNGALSGVLFTSKASDTNFNGNVAGSVPMNLTLPQPWMGAIQVQLSATNPWFDAGSFSKSGGGVTGVVSAVPLPAGVLLGFLGLGAAGMGLRRFASAG